MAMQTSLLALVLATIVPADDTPPRVSAEVKRASNELKEGRPRPKSATRGSTKANQAIAAAVTTPRGVRVKVADTVQEAYYLGKVVSTLSWYAERKDANAVKERLATVRKMVDRADTIAMVDFLSKGATPDVVASAAYGGLLDHLTASIQVELAGRQRQLAGIYRVGLVALYVPLDAPLSAPEVLTYSKWFLSTKTLFGPFPDNIAAAINQLSQPSGGSMLETLAALDKFLSS